METVLSALANWGLVGGVITDPFVGVTQDRHASESLSLMPGFDVPVGTGSFIASPPSGEVLSPQTSSP